VGILGILAVDNHITTHLKGVIVMENKNINLLIVDDEETFLKSIKRSLELRGFNVTAVNRGKKAVAAARQHPIDIALVDLKMPGLDGEETLKQLKEEHPWMEVIILTGHGTIDSAAECTRRGAYSYLQKPCGLDQILESLIKAYKKRVMNKTRLDEQKMDELLKLSLSASPRGILQKLKEMERAFY
jgi:DNA-binding NtrC family response regulator